ncbi:MAG TPA: hypothetical protein VNT30_10740 [Stellaceae bacterium]|nr:hypothetical protein [Stellaceae bacterium]
MGDRRRSDVVAIITIPFTSWDGCRANQAPVILSPVLAEQLVDKALKLADRVYGLSQGRIVLSSGTAGVTELSETLL